MRTENKIYHLLVHSTSHGHAVSCVEHQGTKMTGGFVLNTFELRKDQRKYADDLSKMTGWKIEIMP